MPIQKFSNATERFSDLNVWVNHFNEKGIAWFIVKTGAPSHPYYTLWREGKRWVINQKNGETFVLKKDMTEPIDGEVIAYCDPRGKLNLTEVKNV